MSKIRFQASDILALQSQTFLQSAEWHDSIDSTNTFALQMAREQPHRAPFLVGTSQQTSGRGRGSNVWWSADGALTFSFAVRPARYEIPPVRRSALALITGLTLAVAIQEALDWKVGLKWPNDVLLGGRKLAGILVETVDSRAEQIVIGVGVNFQNTFQGAPLEVQERAISLRDVAGDRPLLPVSEFLMSFLNEWHSLAVQWGAGVLDLSSRWSQYCALQGQEVVLTGGAEGEGRCLGIDSEGRLKVITDQGECLISSGTVRLREG